MSGERATDEEKERGKFPSARRSGGEGEADASCTFAALRESSLPMSPASHTISLYRTNVRPYPPTSSSTHSRLSPRVA